ncbi:MAG: molecular chaperone DnaJ [Chloroflexi bacterium]|nr:molecular chaperone DnaJ [Chloroflexota bacterium]
MTTKRDYYDVLGVSAQASEDDIRKAFRAKAMEYHPDRNKASDESERFKEVNEAYQVLSDPERRQQYDRFGHAGVRNGAGQGAGGFEGFDIFGGFGDIFDAFFGSGTASRTRPRQGEDVRVNVSVTFEEAAFGVEREVEINRTEQCPSCKGTRAEPGTQPETCTNCNGSGRVRRAQRSVFGQFVTEAACNVCGGEGRRITTPCTDCRGAGYKRAKQRIEVSIPAGVYHGALLELRGQGHAGMFGGPPGSLLVGVQVQSHGWFKRRENSADVLLDLNVTFPGAALGIEMEVPTLDGMDKIKVPAGIQSGEVLRMRGKGIPHLGREGRRGDQLVTVRVQTPDKLSKEQKKLLEELQRSFEKK